MTPGRLPNWESGCQNQPRASVAVANLVGAALSIGGGPACGGVAVPFTPHPVASGNIPTSKLQQVDRMVISFPLCLIFRRRAREHKRISR
jgi:hypothetical protein